MKKNEVKNISFQIKAIELLEYALNAPKQPMQDNPVFQYDIQLQQKINNERNLVIVVCSVTISNDPRDQNYGIIKASCIYEVPELKSFIDADTETSFFTGTICQHTEFSLHFNNQRHCIFHVQGNIPA